MMQLLRKVALTVLVGLLVAPSALQILPAHAASYGAQLVSTTGNGSLVIAPDSVIPVEVRVKNTGSEAWVNDGPGYISLYTYEPKYRHSVFDPGTWLAAIQVKRLQEAKVAPGGVGTFTFELHAPKTEGVYKEAFQMAAEDKAWVSGGEVVFNIEVRKPLTKPVVMPAPSTPAAAPASVLPLSSAEVTAQTVTRVEAKAGSVVNVQVAVKNTGTNTWNGFGLLPPVAQIASADTARFNDPSWTSTQVAFASQKVGPGEVGVLSFNLRAPNQNGLHTAKLEVMTDEGRHTNAFISVSLDVTDGAGDAANSPVDEEALNLIDEPILRVGVLIVDEETNNEVYIRSNTSDLSIQNLEGQELDHVPQGTMVWAAYKDGVYQYRIANEVKTSTSALRFVPPAPTDILEIANFDRRVTRHGDFADNTFRGTFELRYNDYKDRVWLIDELPIELYLRGLGETHNSSPYQFQKTLITAARTFAYFNRLHDTKWRREFFTITGYSYDQVYNGYGQEARSPIIVQAVEETAGQVLTYAGEVIAAPYFTQSDGHTRNWSSVWNGSQPWAVSVQVPCDRGKKLLGHGVGLSAQGALCMANQQMLSDDILKFFYTGVDIEKKWE